MKFEFWDGDTLTIKKENNSMILFGDFLYTCTGMQYLILIFPRYLQ